jgi:cobyrinic acid a,c-diamide synthase
MTCFGYLPKSQDIELPSRHLGLTLEERFRADSLMKRLAELVENHIDLDLMLKACALPVPLSDSFPAEQNEGKRPRISVAQDEAFNFTYRANIDALRTLGEVVFFSPIHDKGLPPSTRFLYLPGGYPEFFLPQLTANKSMMESIKGYLDQGGKALAECGGMLYLSHRLTDMDGQPHQMADFLPIHATFQGMRLHLGYRTVETPWGLIHGHEFHYSDILDLQGGKDFHGQESIGTQRTAKGKFTDTRLFRKNGLIAGYTHLYWAENLTFIQKIINMS